MTMPYVDVNGISLYYEISGNGRPIILITGFGGDICSWKRGKDILSEGHEVIMVDNRGAGKTLYGGQFTLDDIANDVSHLMKDLGVEDACILGWSMGSHIAYKTALKAKDRTSALILMSSYRYRPARSKYILDSSLDAVEKGMPMEYLARVMNCMCHTEEFFRDAERSGKPVRLPDLKDPAGLRHQLNAVDVSFIDGSVDSPAIPTLLIHGNDDIMVDAEEGLMLADAIKGCETIIIEGAGHLIPAERYAPAVIDFIKRH